MVKGRNVALVAAVMVSTLASYYLYKEIDTLTTYSRVIFQLMTGNKTRGLCTTKVMHALSVYAISHLGQTGITVNNNTLHISQHNPLPERIDLLNKLLVRLRTHHLSCEPSYNYSTKISKLVWGRDDDYITQLGKLSQFHILALSWIKFPGEKQRY